MSPSIPKPLFLFAPGAGAGTNHKWMIHWAALLGELGLVRPFDYPYMKEGDHSLLVTKRWLKTHDLTQLAIDHEILVSIQQFLGSSS